MSAIALPAPLVRGAPSGYRGLRRAARHGWIGVGLATGVLAGLWAVSLGGGTDSVAYWSVNLAEPWARPEGTSAAFAYSPVAALVFAPFHALPYPVFLAGWTTVLVAVALWLCPPVLWAPAFVLLLGELHAGNIHIPMAAAIVLAMTRSGGWWSVPVLLKVTPGVGLLWHPLRREWRQFGVTLAVTGGLVAVSLVLAAPLWGEWVGWLLTNAGGHFGGRLSLDVPFLPRLVAAGLLVAFAALTDRRWLVPLAALLALPVLWFTAVPAFALASLRTVGLLRHTDQREARAARTAVGC